jgi:hypothetical protein
MRELTLQACRNAGFEPEVAFESEQAQTIQHLGRVEPGRDAAAAHGAAAHREGRTTSAMLRIEPPTPKRTIVAAWKTGRYLIGERAAVPAVLRDDGAAAAPGRDEIQAS